MNPNLEKSKRNERRLARYFREHGLLKAERRARPGWRVRGRQLADEGDLQGIPGICCQAKDYTGSRPLSGLQLDNFMSETIAQTYASGAVIPLLVEKRKGHADPGEWWAWLPQYAYLALCGSSVSIDRYELYPIRVELGHIIDALVQFSRECETDPRTLAAVGM